MSSLSDQTVLSPEARMLEAILFVASTPVAESRIADITAFGEAKVRGAIEELKNHYDAGHGLVVQRVAGGWQMCSSADVFETVSRFQEDSQRVRLSKAAFESLAVVAYNQPVTRGEIEEIRGVRCDRVIETLLTVGLLRIAGRKKGSGSPLLYRTTDLFLREFGLDSISELPTLAELSEMARHKAGNDDAFE